MSADLQISEREREILRLVATGASNQQIALQLNISTNTVKVHLRNIFGKIGVVSRTEATLYAIRQGLVAVEGQPGSPELAAPVVPAVLTDSAPPAEPPPAAEAVALPAETASAVTNGTVVPPDVAMPASAPPVRSRLPLWLVAGVVVLVLAAGLLYLLLPRAQPQPSATPTPAGVTITSAWRTRAALPRPRSEFAVTTDYDGKLYVIGGSAAGVSAAVDRYDPVNDLWVQLNDKPTPVTRALAVTIGGRIYVPGGEDATGQALTAFEAFDPRSQAWEQLAPLPAARSRYGLAAFEGRLYLFGGWDGSRICSEVFVYDPANQRWDTLAQMPLARRDAGAAVLRGRIYLVGGAGENGPLQLNQRFDPTGGPGGQWDAAAPLPSAIAAPALVGLFNGLLAFDAERRQATQYNADTDSWTTVSIPANVALSSRAAGSASVYVFGAPAGTAPLALNEYRAVFNTYLPGVVVDK